MFNEFMDTPIGLLNIVASEEGVTRISIVHVKTLNRPNDITHQAVKELSKYFENPKIKFETPLDIEDMGSDFQQDVWEFISTIPIGKTSTYEDVAKNIEREKSARAVGNALNQNPVLIMIPCHRIIPKNANKDDVGGYAGGVEAKKWLLHHESAIL
jgi:O-6-methylguanine DNA methyltransferase